MHATRGKIKLKVWITKYALTKGIFVVDAELSSDYPSMVSYTMAGGWTQYAHGEGNDWHRSAKQARERAQFMRDKKIAELRKSIARLEAMNFDDCEV